MVIKGLAKSLLLKTYETERRKVAQELILFDQEYSRLWSSRPKKDIQDQDGVSMAEFERAFIQQQLFSSGFGVHYGPSILTAGVSSNSSNGHTNGEGGAFSGDTGAVKSRRHLATKAILGQRFPSFKIINHSDARFWHLANWLPSDGLFSILLFAGDVSKQEQMDGIRHFATEMSRRSQILPLERRLSCRNDHGGQSRPGKHGIARLLTVHSAPRHAVEIHDFPSLLLPYDEDLGYDYNYLFVDREFYYEGHGRAYESYGIDPTRGCAVVIRPDQHVAWIGELEDVQGLEAYFAGIMVDPTPPAL